MYEFYKIPEMPDNTSDFSALYSGNASIYCVYNLRIVYTI